MGNMILSEISIFIMANGNRLIAPNPKKTAVMASDLSSVESIPSSFKKILSKPRRIIRTAKAIAKMAVLTS